jgi:hypothetical protein
MLQNLQNFIQKLNKLQTDTCTAAQSIVNTGAMALMGVDEETCKSYRNIELGEDPSTAQKVCHSMRGPTLNELYDDFANVFSNQPNKKATVPALVPGNSAVQSLLSNNELDTEQKEIAMSLTGFYTRCSNQDGEGSTSRENWNPPTIKFKDFWFGNDNAEVYVWKNDPKDCTVSKIPMKISGFRQKVLDAITRIAQARLTGSQLNADDQAFINASTVPIIPLLDEARNQPAVVNATVELLADVVAVDMAYATIQKYVNAMLSGIGKQYVVDPHKLREAIAESNNQLAWEVANAANIFQVRVNAVNITKLFIDQLKKSNLGPIASKIK